MRRNRYHRSGVCDMDGSMSSKQLEEIINILKSRLTNESKIFLYVLLESGPLYKDELKDLANERYHSAAGILPNNDNPLINSRHAMDIHTARLEGAGLVDIKFQGRVKLYQLSKLGKLLLQSFGTKLKSEGEKV